MSSSRRRSGSARWPTSPATTSSASSSSGRASTDALEPAKFDKLMKDPQRYLFKAFALELIFNQYEVAPYASGMYRVVVPYARLTGMLRPNAPVGR